MMRFFIMGMGLIACESKVSQDVETLQTDLTVSQERVVTLEEELASIQETLTTMQAELSAQTTQNTEQAETIEQLTTELSQRPTTEELEVWIAEKNYMSAEEISDFVYLTAPTITEFDMIIDQVETNADDIAIHNTEISLMQAQ